MFIYTRTTTRIRRHADKEKKKHDPKLRRQANLSLLVVVCLVSVSVCVPVSICVPGLCICVRERIIARLCGLATYPHAQPLCSDFM